MFSVVYGVLLNPFLHVGAERIMQISLVDPAGRFRGTGMSGAQVEELRQALLSSVVAQQRRWNLTTTDGDIPEDVSASYISPNSPNPWGNPALMGRWLIPADAPPGQDPARVVVLGYQFWQRYYSGDPAVIGRTLQLVRKDYQIVGVMPPRFRWREADIYMPLKVRLEPNIYYGVTLKIRPGVTSRRPMPNCSPSCSSSPHRHRAATPTLSVFSSAASSSCSRGRWAGSFCCWVRSRRCCWSAVPTSRSCCSSVVRTASRSLRCGRPWRRTSPYRSSS